MPTIDLRIVREGEDGDWGADGLDLSTALIVPHDNPWHIAILAGGMASGAPSVALWLEVDGQDVVAECSLAALTAVLAGARGAFPEAFQGGPFQAAS